MRVTYLGPCPAVVLPGGVTVARGEAVDVPAEVGKSLCEQSSFEAAAVKKATPAKSEED